MEEANKTYKEEEEFLYDEDYDRSDKEILDGYHKDRDKGYQDGVDYVGETMTKKEIHAYKDYLDKIGRFFYDDNYHVDTPELDEFFKRHNIDINKFIIKVNYGFIKYETTY